MKNIFNILMIMSLILGCEGSADTSQKFSGNSEKEATTKVAVVPSTVMTMNVEGMVCEMGCGASIRKALDATGAVANCSFDFEKGRKTNIATISFDEQRISSTEIVQIVSEMNDEQFKVDEVSTTTIEKKTDALPAENSSEESKKELGNTSISSSARIYLPNLVDFFSKLIIH